MFGRSHMTRYADQAARDALAMQPSMFDEFPSDPDLASLNVHKVAVGAARPYIAAGHYSGTMPDSTREAFAGYYMLATAGVVTFGMGANHAAFTSLVSDIALGEYRELTRLWVDDRAPKNTASRLVSSALKMLPTSVRLVVSFADAAQGHQGYVYQAMNFMYLGTTSPGKSLLDESGQSVHPRLLGIYRMRRKEFAGMSGPAIAEALGWTFADGSVKHRYVLPVGGPAARRKLRAQLRSRELPYPKGNC